MLHSGSRFHLHSKALLKQVSEVMQHEYDTFDKYCTMYDDDSFEQLVDSITKKTDV